jgi:DNA-binding XRE family transcriptional regulator
MGSPKKTSLMDSKLTRKRHELGVTQAEIAKCIGLSDAAYGAWELGYIQSASSPKFNYTAGLKLCELYDMSMEELDSEIRRLYSKRVTDSSIHRGGENEFIFTPPKTPSYQFIDISGVVEAEDVSPEVAEAEVKDYDGSNPSVDTKNTKPLRVCDLPRSEEKYISVTALLKQCYEVLPFDEFRIVESICNSL